MIPSLDYTFKGCSSNQGHRHSRWQVWVSVLLPSLFPSPLCYVVQAGLELRPPFSFSESCDYTCVCTILLGHRLSILCSAIFCLCLCPPLSLLLFHTHICMHACMCVCVCTYIPIFCLRNQTINSNNSFVILELFQLIWVYCVSIWSLWGFCLFVSVL